MNKVEVLVDKYQAVNFVLSIDLTKCHKTENKIFPLDSMKSPRFSSSILT